jgi:diguanylate cyclase (GGDEF)-like protein
MPRAVVAAYVVAGALLAAYIASLMLRRSGQFWPVLDNWCVDVFEVTIALLCLARYLDKRPGRSVGLAMGIGLLAWSIGDVVFTFESQGGASPPTPSAADAFYLMLYPLAYLAIMLLIRGEIRSFKASIWLDGAVAGLGAAAIVCAFVFDTILSSLSGSPAEVATNLAYPVGDLILLAIAVSALVIVPGWPLRLITLVIGCLVLAIGDTVYLFESAAGTYKSGGPLDASWMTALFFLSLTVWQRVGVRRSDEEAPPPSFVLPTVAVVASVAIMFVGNWTHVSGVALGLTVATLALVGVRAALSHRELNELTRTHHHEAVTDELTGLGNRRALTHELEFRLTDPARPDGPDGDLALLMIDLNHFKEINDSFGHPTGDGLLRLIGPRLRSVTRSDDVVARLGGDEFAVLLTGADVEFATSIAERITSEIQPPFEVEGSSLHVGASIGIALSPRHASSATELMRCADVAMYRAKAAHSPYDIYESTLDDGADRLNLMEDLRRALECEGLTLYYQPQIDLRSGAITTLEALLRWPHPTLGFIPPDQFIPLAEDSGLMGPLTAFVLERAVAQCAAWRHDGHDVAVAVNLSTTNLLDTSLPDQILEVLDRHDLPTSALVLEITESTVMADLARSKEVIEVLSSAGLLISIDDFGTGFSSLAYLSDLAVGELKIDRMFTARLSVDGADGRDEAIIRSSIELGHSLGLRVVAEGVERSDHFGFLATAGCDVAQGYAISFPQPPEALDFAAIDDRAAPMLPPGLSSYST